MLLQADGVPDCFPLSDVFKFSLEEQFFECQELAHLGKCWNIISLPNVSVQSDLTVVFMQSQTARHVSDGYSPSLRPYDIYSE